MIPVSVSNTALENTSVVLSFSITTGFPPVSSEGIQWLFQLRKGAVMDITLSTDPRLSYSPDRLSLTLTGITYFEEGVYTVIASNAAGSGNASILLNIESEGNSLIANQLLLIMESMIIICYLSAQLLPR